jgi:hypothetical protein
VTASLTPSLASHAAHGDGGTLDLTAVRAAFPALQRVHGGHPVAYLDGPGGTQVPRAVVDAMADYLLHHNANTHWAYPTSVETDVIIDRRPRGGGRPARRRRPRDRVRAQHDDARLPSRARAGARWRRHRPIGPGDGSW